MSMTIYGGMTQNGVIIDDMVDNHNDSVYFINEDETMFIRVTCGKEKEEVDVWKTALAVFSITEPFVPIYGELLDEEFDNYFKDDEFKTSSKFIDKFEVFKQDYQAFVDASSRDDIDYE